MTRITLWIILGITRNITNFVLCISTSNYLCVSLVFSGPATVRMVSNNGPPLPMPMQVPPGHMVQQIVDENGYLTHVILSPQPAGMPAAAAAAAPPPPPPPPFTVGYYVCTTLPHYFSSISLYISLIHLSQLTTLNKRKKRKNLPLSLLPRLRCYSFLVRNSAQSFCLDE